MKAPGAVLAEVEPDSAAQTAGLRPGDRLLAINGHAPRDVIDVQFYSSEETLDLRIERDGQPMELMLERSYGQPLGLTFLHPTFDMDVRRCSNACDFCFVKQNAPGMRRSLYVKDDDYRYSFLFGSFVTLTNLDAGDWARLEEQRLSPLFVSVHTTDPELRRRFLGCRKAPDITEQLDRLAGMGIDVHTQVVLVPGLNDGSHLERTVDDLTALYRKPVLSVSIVPVGLTRFHRGGCRPYTPEEMLAVLQRVEAWGEQNRRAVGCTFTHASDEWYLVARREVPAAEAYDGFPQAENGVGMVRLLLDEWQELKAEGAWQSFRHGSAMLVCGTLAAPLLARVVAEWNALAGADLRLVPVVNRFFGALTTVSGLLTGQDVVEALRDERLGDAVLLPRAMFTGRYGAGDAPPDTTLDDMSLAAIADRLGARTVMAATLREAVAALGDRS